MMWNFCITWCVENLLKSNTTTTDESRASWADHPRTSAIRWKEDEIGPEKDEEEVSILDFGSYMTIFMIDCLCSMLNLHVYLFLHV